jgi:cytochrome oxidase Cu insertion factor (SCO1/SenC/PrrC family)
MKKMAGWMVAIMIVAIVIVAAVAYALLIQEPEENGDDDRAEVGSPAPDFRFQSLDGTSHNLSDFYGTVVMIDFMSTGCPTYMDEMSDLQGVKDTYGDDVEILTISVDPFDDVEDMEYFRDTYGGEWVYGLNSSVGTDYYVVFLPSVYVLDADGIVRFTEKGFIEDGNLESHVESLL